MKFARTIADPYSKRTANRTATIVIMIVAYPEWLASHFGRDSPAKTGAGLNPCAHVGTLSSAAGGTLLSKLFQSGLAAFHATAASPLFATSESSLSDAPFGCFLDLAPGSGGFANEPGHPRRIG